jgi:hypothetical protein
MVSISHDTDRRVTLQWELPYFPRGQFERCKVALLRHKLQGISGATPDLAAFARDHLNIVDESTHRDIIEWHRIPGLNFSIRTGLDRLADIDPIRG